MELTMDAFIKAYKVRRLVEKIVFSCHSSRVTLKRDESVNQLQNRLVFCFPDVNSLVRVSVRVPGCFDVFLIVFLPKYTRTIFEETGAHGMARSDPII